MAGTPGAIPAVLRETEFLQIFSWEVQRATRYQDFLTLCLVQVDPPSRTWSAARDAVAQKLIETLRASDIVGLLGDDIAVLLVHASEDEARTLARRIQRHAAEVLSTAPREADPHPPTPRVSIASFPTDATDDSRLLTHARSSLGRLS